MKIEPKNMFVLFLCLTPFFSAGFFDELYTNKSVVKTKTYPQLNDLDPVILIPGLAASRLEASSNNSSYKTLWLNVTQFLHFETWKETFKPDVDAETGTYSTHPGYDVRVVDYGTVNGINYLEPSFPHLSVYWGNLIDALHETGYTDNYNLFGAPFDWRVETPYSVLTDGCMQRLKELVEYAYSVTGRKVHLIGHSMGTSIIYQLLSAYVPQTWKDKYVASYIATSPPLGGALEALAHITCPHAWGNIPIPASLVHPIAKDLASIQWMVPNKNAYDNSTILMTIKVGDEAEQVVTVDNITYPFTSTNRTDVAKLLQRFQDSVNHFEPPNVPVYVIYSYGEKTVNRLNFKCKANKNWWDYDADVEYGDGDGTVPIESLTAAAKWANQQSQPVTVHALEGLSHVGLVRSTEMIDLIIPIVARNV